MIVTPLKKKHSWMDEKEISQKPLLAVDDHDRGNLSLKHVYVVLSRRSGGLSLGINLNPEKTCNWRCVYCQVAGLSREKSPPVSLVDLKSDLEWALDRYQEQAWGSACLQDVAFSGDGEPTACPNFLEAVDVVCSVLKQRQLLERIPLVCISNGSLVNRYSVEKALVALGKIGGQLWFKVDGGRSRDFLHINQIHATPAEIQKRITHASHLLPVWLQTCVFRQSSKGVSMDWLQAYVEMLLMCREHIQGIQLYTTVRPCALPEGQTIEALSLEELDFVANHCRNEGFLVRCFA